MKCMDIAKQAILEKGAIQDATELAALIQLLQDSEVKNFMEIGTEAGGTFWAFCQAIQPGGIKISLDLPTGLSGSWNYSTPPAEEQRRKLLQSYSDRVCVLTGDSHDSKSVASVWIALRQEQLDFLFIDGDHSTEGVRKDFEMYSPFVKKGGIIAFHDIKDCEFHKRRDCFVHEFWQELKGHKQEFIGPCEWGGIGILFI